MGRRVKTAARKTVRATRASAGQAKAAGKGRSTEKAVQSRDPLQIQAYEAIRALIISCELKPGEQINEHQLCARLGFGRTPVHQAISQLQLQGMVVVLPRKGTIVKALSLEEAIQLGEIRVVNEAEAAKLAAIRATEEEIDALEAHQKRLNEAYEKRDVRALMQADRAFHSQIYSASRNSILHEILTTLYDRAQRRWYQALLQPDYFGKPGTGHDDIIGALRRRDPEAAAAAMRGHIVYYRRSIVT